MPASHFQRPSSNPAPREVRIGPSSDDAHDIAYFRRHQSDDPTQTIPGRDFIRACPPNVRNKIAARLIAVAAAPPKRFAGGGYWEAMRADMTGWFELRADGPHRRHYRLFCLLDYEAMERRKPLLVIVTGLDKPFGTGFTAGQYAAVRALGREYLSRNPRSLA